MTARDRRALLAVAVQFFINGALLASFVPRLPTIRSSIGISTAQLGLLLSLAGAVSLLGSAIVGRLIERLGTRAVMLAGSLSVACFLAVVGVAGSAFVLFVGLAAMLTFDLFVDVAMNLQGSWLSAKRSVPVMNRLHGLWSVGTVAGGVVASVMAQAGISLRAHLIGSAVVLAVAAVGVSQNVLPTDEQQTEVGPQREASSGWKPNRMLASFAAAGFFALVMEAAAYDWAAFRLSDDLGTTEATAALAYVASTVGMAIGRFTGDQLTTALPARQVAWLSATLAGLGFGAAALVDDVAVVVIAFAVTGFAMATIMPGLYDRAAKLPGRRGAGLGALTAGLRVASLSGPVLLGSIAAATTVGTAIAVIALPSAVGFAMVMRRQLPAN